MELVELLRQAELLERELLELLQAEELDDERLAGLVERRNLHYEAIAAALDEEPELSGSFKPVFETALHNTQTMLAHAQTERDAVQKKLIELNTSKKARKAY